MRDLLSTFEQISIPLLVWFALPDGSYYTVDAGLADRNLSDRPYFPEVISGHSTIGDLMLSQSTGKKSMVGTMPVVKDGSVSGALGISLYLDQLSQLTTADLRLSNGMVFLCRQRKGSDRTAQQLGIDLGGFIGARPSAGSRRF